MLILALSAPRLDLKMLGEVAQVGNVVLGDECTLHQRGAGNFSPALSDTSGTQTIVGLANAWRHAKEGGEVTAFRKIPNVDDGAEQCGCPDFYNTPGGYQTVCISCRRPSAWR